MVTAERFTIPVQTQLSKRLDRELTEFSNKHGMTRAAAIRFLVSNGLSEAKMHERKD